MIWCKYLIIKSFDLSDCQVNFSEVSDFCNYWNLKVIQLSVVFYYLLLEGYSSSNLRLLMLFLMCTV